MNDEDRLYVVVWKADIGMNVTHFSNRHDALAYARQVSEKNIGKIVHLCHSVCRFTTSEKIAHQWIGKCGRCKNPKDQRGRVCVECEKKIVALGKERSGKAQAMRMKCFLLWKTGMTCAQIGAALGLSENAVRERISRLRGRTRRQIQYMFYNPPAWLQRLIDAGAIGDLQEEILSEYLYTRDT